ncbi:MAG: TonB-dependent receptor [Verrucomicrobia bacterium]|nr:TonB-dependent receptor [Verrucomicrobiota bacterium]
MNSCPRPLRVVSLGLMAALAVAPALQAQTSAVSKPVASATASDEPIVMSEFNVAGTDDGWVATNALSGTRTNMNLRELPRSIQVVTSEFMNDIGALTLTDATDFMSGITNVGNQDQTNDNNTYQVRGFRQNKPYRNGMREPFAGMLFDSATMDRVEVLKGPSSLLAGVAEPGGMFNSVSKLPRPKREISLTVRGDNWGMLRGEIDASMPLGARLATRLVLVRQAGDAWQQFAWANRTVYYGSLSYKVAENTRYTANLEYIDYLACPPAPRSTVASTSPLAAFTWHRNGAINGLDLNGTYIPWDFNPLGPNNRRTQRIVRAGNQVEHRFNPMFSLRVAGNFTRMHRIDRRLSGTQISTRVVNGLTVPSTTALSSTNDDETVNTYTAQGDLVGRFHYWRIAHQAILGAEYIDTDNHRIRDNTPALTPYVFGGTVQPAWTEMLDSSRYTLPNNRLNAHARRRGYSLTNVFALFDNRAHLMAGVRHDEGTIINRNPIGLDALARYQRVKENANSPTVGAAYRVNEWLSVFTSSSRSFAGVPVSAIDIYGKPLDKQVGGKGYDVGIKTALFQNRVFFNAAGFQVDQINGTRQAVTSDIIEAGLDPLVVTGARSIQDVSARSRGWESDVTVKLFDGYQIAGTYTNLHAYVTANKSNPAAVGGPVSQGPGRESWSFFHKYDLPGGLFKGLTLTHGVVFRDSRRPTVPGFTRQDASASFRATIFQRRVAFTVRVQNLQDIKYWEGFQSRGAPRTTSFSLNTRL